MSLFLCQFTKEYSQYMCDDRPAPDTNQFRLVEAESADEAEAKLVAKLEHIDTYGFSVFITNIEVSGVI